ncbi:conserved hypothetical protein [Delftia phage PhiW-14]|uniref:Uncharacterized protein n=1 Tax=Delftia phage PhiW-14 TaxID=665032 RepID=C9DGH8_BPW14|nr:hypothetical protein DP-phiW-14_gp208 [Delftia phage PhiW-14]ACV50229.1 conserved hypothetical protein [Delftia phage PhiW-14]
MTASINTIITNNNGFELIIDGLGLSQVHAALATAGIECGKTSLRKVINGAGKACGLERIQREVVVITEVEEVKPAADVTSILKVREPRLAPMVPVTPEQVDAVQAAVKADEAKETKVETEGVAPSDKAETGTTETATPAAKVIKGVRRGTKNDIVFKMLCRAEGATIKEVMAECGWTEGGASSIIYWEPADKGYDLLKEKVAGRGTVIRLGINGVAITEDQIVYF